VVPRIVRHYGEPFADSSAIPSFYLAELTRRHVTVALNGDGGDESFAGYQRYVANAVAERLDRIPALLRHAVAGLAARVPDRGDVSSKANRFRRLGGSLALGPAERYTRYVSWFDGAQRDALYTPAFAAEVHGADAGEEIAARWAAASGDSAVDRMLEVDASTYLVDDLIAKVDIATMAHALEARSPLLDHELMELAASIPGRYKVRGGEKKWIFREALRPWLPSEILDRPKQGFSVPLSSWLRTDLQGWARDILLDPSTLERGCFEPAMVRRLLDRHAAGSDGDAQRIYSLLMLELWQREFVHAPALALAA
jgi:asparagine synthase (glutamine-hydrolysing)